MNVQSGLLRSVAVSVLAFSVIGSSSSQIGSQARSEADSVFFQRDYESAIPLYERVVKSDPNDAESWYRLAYCLHSEKRYRESVSCYEEAVKRKYNILNAMFNIACAYSRGGESEKALDYLESAIASGYLSTDSISTDTDLAPVRNTERFRSLLERARRPVEYYDNGRRMGSTSGAWSVRSAAGSRGTLTSNSRANGFVRQLDLVLDGSREMSLLLYFSAPDNEWRVSGCANDGTLYSGKVELGLGSIGCQGVRDDGGNPTQVRATFTLGGLGQPSVIMEEQAGSKWVTKASFSLESAN